MLFIAFLILETMIKQQNTLVYNICPALLLLIKCKFEDNH